MRWKISTVAIFLFHLLAKKSIFDKIKNKQEKIFHILYKTVYA